MAEMNERRILFKNTFFYTAIQVLTKSINLILIPVFVAYLSIESYGIVNLILVLVAFFTLLTISGMTEALMRFYVSARLKRLKGIILTTVLTICLILGLILATIPLIIEKKLAIWIFDSPEYITLILPIILIGLLESINQIIFTVIRAEKRVKRYNISVLTKTLSYLVFNIITLIYLRLDVWGFLISLFLSTFLVIIINVSYLIRRLNFEFNQKVLRMVLSFGLPYLVAGLSLQLLFKIDHIILKFLIGVEAVAIYGMSYMLGSSIQYLNTAFSFAWYPHLFELSSKSQMRQEVPLIFSTYVMLLIPIGLALTAGNYHILPYIIPHAYKHVISIIPWIIWGYFLFGLLDFFAAGLLIKYKTTILSLITLTAAILNILLNFILIYFLGILGAAIATFASFTFIIILAYYHGHRLFKIDYSWHELRKPISVYLIIFILGFLISFKAHYINIVIGIAHIMLLLISPFLFNFIDYKKVKAMYLRE